MTYIAEIENNKIINEFKKAVKKTGKSKSDVLVQLMAKFVDGKEVVKVIVVPNKLVNIVVKG